jgi:ABC-type Fe3+/spermidine/putrescine transport system ATPase subunit
VTAVSIRGLSRSYTGAPALTDLSVDIAAGEMVALLGPSGSGKTTALKIIAGLLDPTAGEVLFDDRPVLGDPPDQRGAVMVFQNPLLFPYMNVEQNVGFGLRMRHLPKAEVKARVNVMLKAVRLTGYGARKPSELSGGQAQRVALARALILRPRVLLLDEPLSSLDAHLRADMRDLIRGLQRETGITTLFVTHDQEEAVTMADRIALLLDGRLRQFDHPEAFYQRPADADVATFFGAANLVQGTARDGVFHCPLGTLRLPADARSGAGTLTFRPEAVRFGPGPENTLSARVVERMFLGPQTRLRLMVGDVAIEASLAPDQATGMTRGQQIEINLAAASLWVMP